LLAFWQERFHASLDAESYESGAGSGVVAVGVAGRKRPLGNGTGELVPYQIAIR